jgi:lysophospholipase L1-like esterase
MKPTHRNNRDGLPNQAMPLLIILTMIGLPCVSFAQTSQPSPKARITLVGDSTVTDASGWGTGFKALLTDEVQCTNCARGGRSSKSYRDEGHWDTAIVIPADYMLIQFGHNDQPGKGAERETDPNTTFRENMKRYVSEARAKGITPILVTSLTRRNFGDDGKIKPDQLVGYVAATKAVAAEMNVPLIDLYTSSLALCNSLGPEGCERISPPPKDGKPDKTHLNGEGSKLLAPLVTQELAKLVPQLARYIKPTAQEKQP